MKSAGIDTIPNELKSFYENFSIKKECDVLPIVSTTDVFPTILTFAFLSMKLRKQMRVMMESQSDINSIRGMIDIFIPNSELVFEKHSCLENDILDIPTLYISKRLSYSAEFAIDNQMLVNYILTSDKNFIWCGWNSEGIEIAKVMMDGFIY